MVFSAFCRSSLSEISWREIGLSAEATAKAVEGGEH